MIVIEVGGRWSRASSLTAGGDPGKGVDGIWPQLRGIEIDSSQRSIGKSGLLRLRGENRRDTNSGRGRWQRAGEWLMVGRMGHATNCSRSDTEAGDVTLAGTGVQDWDKESCRRLFGDPWDAYGGSGMQATGEGARPADVRQWNCPRVHVPSSTVPPGSMSKHVRGLFSTAPLVFTAC